MFSANVNSHARYCDSFRHRSIIPCSARSLSSILLAQSFGPVPQFSVCFVPSTSFFFSAVLLRFHWRAGFTGDSKGRRPVLRCSASWLFAVAGERRANGRASHHASVAGHWEAQCDGDNGPHSLDTSLMHPRLQAAGTLVYTGITKHTYQPSRMRSRRNFGIHRHLGSCDSDRRRQPRYSPLLNPPRAARHTKRQCKKNPYAFEPDQARIKLELLNTRKKSKERGKAEQFVRFKISTLI